MLQGGVEGHAALDKAHGHTCTRNTADTGDERRGRKQTESCKQGGEVDN